MQKENHDSGARIRHVPIKVEARDNGRRDNWSQQNQQYFDEQNQDHRSGQQFSTDQQPADSSVHDDRYNTSSININYRPQPPPRVATPQESTAQSGLNDSTNRSPQPANEHVEERKSRSWLRGKNKKGRSKDRVKAAREKSSNSDKLVNSPEPIPLPPPQNSEPNKRQSEQVGTDNKRDFNSAPMNQRNETAPVGEPQSADKTPRTPKSTIDHIKQDINNLLQRIVKFDGTSASSKDYRYLDEMLTRCMLSLDTVDCTGSTDLRMQRKLAIGFVDKATDILQRKLQVNFDINNLTQDLQ